MRNYSELIPRGLNILTSLLGQTDIEVIENSALKFSGPQFFTALIAGVILAFGFQLLFTNLGVAYVASSLGSSSSSDDNKKDHNKDDKTIQKLGLATTISVTIALFLASFLAVKLSLFISPISGAIIGLVIWGTFFSLMVWLSTSKAASLVGSMVNTATSGFQAIWDTATAAIGSKLASKRVVDTAEATAKTVRRELMSAIDPEAVKENLEDYLETIKPPQLDLAAIRSEIEKLLADPNFKAIANSDSLSDINRDTFVNLVSQTGNLSKKDVNSIANLLEKVWQEKIGQSQQKQPLQELTDYLKSASAEQLLGKEFSHKIDALIAEMRANRANNKQNQSEDGPMAHAMAMGINSLIGMVMGRTDLSDLDVEKTIAQIEKLKGYLGEQKDIVSSNLLPASNYSPLQADVEDYLLNNYFWRMSLEKVQQEFRDILYDPEADPGIIQAELEQLDRSYFVKLLKQRGIFTQKRILEIASVLETVRQEVLLVAQKAIEQEKRIELLSEVEKYLLNTPVEDLTPDKIQIYFKPILEDHSADYEQLSDRLARLDSSTFKRIFAQREDIAEVEASAIISDLEIAKAQVLKESQQQFSLAKAKAERQWLKVQSYLRDTNKEELNPEGIKRELKLILEDPQTGASALQTRVSSFERDTLVQLLSQRDDVSEEQINDILDEVEATWYSIIHKSKKLVGQVKTQYEEISSAIANYLRNTDKQELNPEGIKRDLGLLLKNPQAGSKAIKRRLATMERDTLVQLLAQRKDLSEQQANQIIDEVLYNLRSLVKVPRRMARRSQQQIQSFQDSIKEYLYSTEREELNPDGIQRDIELLINDPRAGVESLTERLSQMDKDTLVALVSQRKDINPEDVNQIVNQILAVRDRFSQQLEQIKQSIQSVIDKIFAKIRNYLNSLERPELNYDGIKADVRTLFDDPQAGFDALRLRLSECNRDTLVAILSSRDDISQADADRIIYQVESVRDRVLQRVERLELKAQEMKAEAIKQAENTRRAAAKAAWWLFFTATISGIASALAGALAVLGYATSLE